MYVNRKKIKASRESKDRQDEINRNEKDVETPGMYRWTDVCTHACVDDFFPKE